MLGATDPSSFSIKFSCNNIHAESTSPYHSLGTLVYDQHCRTKFKCHTNIWSDKLIVSARFLAITVIVYGTPKDDEIDSVQKKNRNCNIPFFSSSNGIMVPDIMALANNRYLEPNLADDLSDLQFDSNYY